MKNKFISILKAILATLIYILAIELLAFWIHIADFVGYKDFYKHYPIIHGFVQFSAVLIFIYFVKNRTLKNLIKLTHYKWYLFALILGILYVFIQTPLNWIYNLLFETEFNIAYKFDGFSNFNNINIIAFILLIPIGEELFFREYIQNNLQKRTNAIIAIGISTLLFASIHSPYLNLLLEYSNLGWHSFYVTIFGGLISGILYFKSKSIGPSIIFHIFWNLMSYII